MEYAIALSPAQVEAAVSWWAAALRDPTFRLGDSSVQTIMAETLAARARRPSAEQVQKFADALRATLQKGMGAMKYKGDKLWVDYDACEELRDALTQAGLDGKNITLLPWKTSMKFANGGVQVSCGYGAEWKELVTT